MECTPAFIRFTSYTFDGLYFIEPSDCPRFLFILPWLQFQSWILIVVCLDDSRISKVLYRLLILSCILKVICRLLILLSGLSCCFHWTVPLFVYFTKSRFGFKLLSALDNSPLSLRLKKLKSGLKYGFHRTAPRFRLILLN